MKNSENHTSESQESETFLIFRVGQELYGTPLLAVREVMEFRKPKPLPNTMSHFLGVINIRGEIVGVIDLYERLGVGKKTSDIGTFVVVDTANGTIATRVDEVCSVHSITTEDIDTQSREQVSSSYFKGIAKLNKDLVTILDLTLVITAQDISILNTATA